MIVTAPIDQCPVCGYYISAATDLRDPAAVPEPGDWTVCIACVAPLKFVGPPPLRVMLLGAVDFETATPARRAELEAVRALIRKGHQLGLRPRGRYA